MLQWGHASSRVETHADVVVFLWRKRLQWGHASSRVETSISRLSNETNLMLQWGHASSRVETGNGGRIHDAAKRCFNGATRLHAWKPTSAIDAIRLAALQWGHASSRVETLFIWLKRSFLRLASMGPRVFTRGNFSEERIKPMTQKG